MYSTALKIISNCGHMLATALSKLRPRLIKTTTTKTLDLDGDTLEKDSVVFHLIIEK